MDFVGVPAGTAAAQALVMRGADHDVELAASHPAVTTLGTTLDARNAVNANQRLMKAAAEAIHTEGATFSMLRQPEPTAEARCDALMRAA